MCATITGKGEAATLIGDITKQIMGEGAWLNPDLEIRVDGPNVSMLSRNPFIDKRSVIRVPIASMPALEDFDVTVSGDVFEYEAVSKGVSTAHVDMMGRMLDVYNALGKIAQWKTETPWFSLSTHTDALDHLISARPLVRRLQELRTMMNEGEWDKLAGDTFLGSRKFNLSAKHLKSIGKDIPEGSKVIMPLIDYFNHRMNAESFKITPLPLPVSMRIISTPHPDSGELFVRYNVFDALDTYLYYGFVDTGVGYLSSVPCTITLGDTVLNVISQGGMKNANLPTPVKDLKLFMPELVKTGENEFAATKMVIPGLKAPRAMRRVLTIVMNSLQVPKNQVSTFVRDAEEQILSANEQWWSTLAEKSQVLPEEHGLRMLCQTGQEHLAQYRAMQGRAG
jgi:hypothetical protein